MSFTPPGPPPLPPLPSAPPPRRRSGVALGVIVGFLVFAIVGCIVATVLVVVNKVGDSDVVTGTGPTPVPTRSDAPMPQTPAALARFYDQELTWKKCGE